jgi:hypothetical protein
MPAKMTLNEESCADVDQSGALPVDAEPMTVIGAKLPSASC